MSVYKEIGSFVREIQSNSQQIYPDACDYGVPVYDYKESRIQQLGDLIKMYDMEVSTLRYSTGATQQIIFDSNGSSKAEAGFNTAVIEFVTVNDKSMKGYLQISAVE